MEQIGDAKYTAGPDIVCLEGNGARPSHRGDGWVEGEVMYTLNSTEVHCVCYPKRATDEIHKSGIPSA